MKFAYADPPYLGLSKQFYGKIHSQAADYDDPETHRKLVEKLVSEFPDGWAMSLHTPSLKVILPMCPIDVRVMAWCKSFASFKPGNNPAYAWEPVIVRGGRKHKRTDLTVTDYFVCPITLRRGFVGAKPEKFVWWLLSILNVSSDDEFVDLFPGLKLANDLHHAITLTSIGHIGRITFRLGV